MHSWISEAIARAIERWSMYRHILIPTDGSELAEHAVTNGLSLAKSVGAKVTVIIVHEAPVDATLSFLEQVEKHAVRVLNRAADAARPVYPATRCKWRRGDPIKPLLQWPRTEAAISSSCHRTGAAGCPHSYSAV